MDADARRGAALTIGSWLQEAVALREDITGAPPSWLTFPDAQAALHLLEELEARLENWGEAVRAHGRPGG